MGKFELDFLDISQLIGALKSLCRRKQRVRISRIEDIYLRKVAHEIHKLESMKRLIPSLRHRQFISPIVSCPPHPFLSFFLSFSGVNKKAESLIKTSRNQIEEVISLLEKRRAKIEEIVTNWQNEKLSEIDENEKTTQNVLDTLSEVCLFIFLFPSVASKWESIFISVN